MTSEEYAKISASIPHAPGVYKYINSEGKIIYVGKAKDLRKRVSSYFTKQHQYYKTKKLVEKIDSIEFTIVSTEKDALLLESNLIKQYQPLYNIELKDDKSYPYIVIKKEEYPRIFLTRRIIKDGSTYLGPYTSVSKVRELLLLIRQSLPIRTCTLDLTEKNIAQNKFKACLEYQLGNCHAPCIGKQSKEDYNWYIQQTKEILKGRLSEIKKFYTQKMNEHSAALEFEQANFIKQKLDFLNEYNAKSVIVNANIHNVDVCSIYSDESFAVVNYLCVQHGSIAHSKTIEVEKKLDESDAEILTVAIPHLRELYKSDAQEIIAPMLFDLADDSTIHIPRGGDKLKLLELSQKNVAYFFSEAKRKKTLHLTHEDKSEQVLKEIQQYLSLPELPRHIECFDNSNFQGSFPVAAMVCFKDGKPFKPEYRRFHIKTVEGINDFASMSEIVHRRYSRVLKEGKPLPDLIIIDGGKGQLNAAIESLEQLDLVGKVNIVGLAKNIEELFFPGDKESIKLPYRSDALHLITYIRDEVHRFGITFHRNTRSKGVIKNELESIKGVGPKTATMLLTRFKSVKKISEASIDEMAMVVGIDKARIVYAHFHEDL